MIASGTRKSTALARWLLGLALALPAAVAAQSYNVSPTNPASGSTLAHAFTDVPLQIRLTDLVTGTPVGFYRIDWTITAGPAGASVNPAFTNTCGGRLCPPGSAGLASTTFRGPAGTYTVNAFATDVCPDPPCANSFNFTVTIEQIGMSIVDPAGGSDSIAANVSRNLEIYWGGPTLPKAADTITWSIQSEPTPGAGTLTATSTSTDGSGHSLIGFSGSVPGTYTIRAFNGCTFCSPISQLFTIDVATVPAMSVAKVLSSFTDTDSSTDVTIGDVLNYTVTASNTGTAVLTNVLVGDDHFPATQSCATLAPGADCVLTGSYTVTAADGRVGAVNNIGAARSNEFRVPITDTLLTPVLPSTPGMTVSKVLSSSDDNDRSGSVTEGDVLHYTVTAHNSGNVVLTSLTVSDDHFPATQSCPTVAVGADCVLTGAYSVTAADVVAGSVTNIGSATSTQVPGPVTDTVNTPVAASPALTVAKSLSQFSDNDSSGSVSEGDTLVYRVAARNVGNIVLTDVIVSDDHFSATQACASLAVGGDCLLTGAYTVTAADARAGVVRNVGSATCNEIRGPVTASLDTPVLIPAAAAISISKVLQGYADNDNSGSVTAADALNYLVTAANSGDVALTNVLVSDDHFAATQSCPQLAPGGNCVLSGSYIVAAADANAGSVTNIGQVTSTEVPGPLTASVTTPVFTPPAMTVAKTLDGYTDADRSGTVTLGDTLNYTVTAHNAGKVTLGNVRVSDDHFSATQTCASLAGGSDCVLVGNYLVTAADARAGSITNTGSATSTEVPGPVSASVDTAVTAPPSTLSIVSGNNQTGVTGSTADQPLVVELRDGFGAPAANQPIGWAVTAGTAGLSASSTLTDAAGRAQVNLKFATSAGAAVITASAPSGSPSVSFNASSVNAMSIAPASGDNQVGPVSSALPLPLRVRITPPVGVSSIPGGGNQAARAANPLSLAGVPVTFAVTSGGGSVSVTQTVTDASGEAATVFTLGPTPGAQSVTASVPGASTTFHATAFTLTGGLTVVSGNNQTLPTNTASAPLVVELRDALNVAAAGVTIHWAANNGTLAQATSLTDAQGRASNTVTVTLPGAASVSASSTLPAAGPVTFVINGAVANLPQLTGEQKAIARAIDALCPALAGLGTRTPGQQDLFLRCKEIVDSAGIDPESTVAALDQLFTDIALAQGNAAFDAAAAQFQNLKARIAALRSGTGGSSFGGLALNGPGGSIGLGTLATLFLGEGDQEIGSDFDRWGFFLSGNIGRGQSRAGSINPAYDYDLVGLSAGVDYRKSDKLVVGAALGYTAQDTELDRGRGNMDMSGFSVSGYGTYFTPNNWYGDFVLTWGKNDYDMQRSINYTVPLPGGGSSTIDTEARSSSGGDMLEGAFTLGRDFQKGAWGFGPYARVLYTKVSFDQITEHIATGPGSGLALVIEPRDLTSLASQVGGKLTFTHSTAWGVLMPHFQLEWQHEYKDDVQQLSATFLNDPTRTAITVSGDALDGSYFRVGVGLSMVLTRGRSGFFYYERMIGRDGLSQDNLALGLRMEF